MTLQEAISILTIHQQWRQGADIVMIEPKELSQAIDIILDNHLHNQLAEASKMVSDENVKPLTYSNEWLGKDYTETQKNEERINNAKIIREVMSWEGCDGCTEQDEVMYKNGYAKGYNAAIADLPKEISDEEIYKESFKKESPIWHEGFIAGAKWYREKLKNK